MRRPFLFSLATLILGSGIALAWRLRPPAAQNTSSQGCAIEQAGEGRFLHFTAKDVPVRRLAWAESEEAGFRYLQVATQNDHQLLYRIPPSGPATCVELQRLEGISESFLRTATLHRVVRLPDASLLLHFVAEGPSGEPGLLSCVDPATGRSRWHRRVDGSHSRFSITPQGAMLLLFGTTPGLTCLRWPTSFAALFAPSVEPLALPEQDRPVLDALPLAAGDLLATTGCTLFRWSKADGWRTLHSAPASVIHPRSSIGRFALSGGRVLWQPIPGSLFALDPEAPAASPVPVELPAPPNPLDLDMLRLAGSDPEGRLWFDLLRPEILPTPRPLALAPPDPGGAWRDDRLAAGPDEEAWKTHLAQPLDRVYAWKPDSRQFLTITWSELLPRLGAPAELRATSLQLYPSQGLATTLEPSPAWWIPLSSLLERASQVQPR